MWISPSGQVFGRFNLIDFLTTTFAVLLIVGVLVVQSGWYRTSGQMVKGESDIQYTVLLRNVKTLNPDLFQAGKNLSITIRNQPRGSVKIVNVARSPRKAMAPTGSGYELIDDPIETNSYDYMITLQDHALVTADGYVTEGVKVKIGSHIEVEDKLYRLPGVIMDVKETQ